MDIEQLQQLLLWCLLVNTGIYALTAIAVLAMRDTICKLQRRMFGLDDETSGKAMQSYLATYKLVITAFNFAPWIATLIVA